jgi:transcription antitermination factor NusG
MVLEYGDVSKVQNQPWFLCELRSEKTIESTMRRVGKALDGIFRGDPIEIFIPVTKRDLDVFEMSTGPYVFVRSTSFAALLRLKSVTGVVSLVTEGDTNRPSKAISVPDDYVQGLIKAAEEEHRKRAIGIEVGSFVRILNGETRDFCGTVEIVGDGKAVVRIMLRTKFILLETPIRNLLNLSHVPKERRVYYYSPQIDELFKDCPEKAAAMVDEDMHLDESVPVPEQPAEPPVEEPKKHSRQRTVTALVKKLILIEGLHNPLRIAEEVVKALRGNEIKPPKNLFIVYCIIKDRLRQDYFLKIDPEIKDHRDIIKKYGHEYKFTAAQIAKIDPELGIPVQTAEVCKDGRSREARQKSKAKCHPAAEVKKIAAKEKPVPKKRKKLPTDRCGECLHERRVHKLSPKGAWMRCSDVSNHAIHHWVEKGSGSKPCWCRRFKEKEK